MNKRKTGTAYEIIAAEYLKKQGMQILEMNYMASRGEIDIIGKQSEMLIFIEVKYRKNASYGHPWEAISIEKQRKICYAAKQYIFMKQWKKQIRFDVVSICGNDIFWFPNAFEGKI
ncbi:MAG: YraN family protein [Lachnospiraceae bacterium]|nr:YraN family protein [Lachnospiraceae bacterium]